MATLANGKIFGLFGGNKSFRGSKGEVSGSQNIESLSEAYNHPTQGSSIPDSPYKTGRNPEPGLQDTTIQEGNLKPPSENVTKEKSRRKSWLKKWQELTNPKAEFSDEYVKERTGMTRDELAEWLKDPENKKKAEKLWPSAVYWAAL